MKAEIYKNGTPIGRLKGQRVILLEDGLVIEERERLRAMKDHETAQFVHQELGAAELHGLQTF